MKRFKKTLKVIISMILVMALLGGSCVWADNAESEMHLNLETGDNSSDDQTFSVNDYIDMAFADTVIVVDQSGKDVSSAFKEDCFVLYCRGMYDGVCDHLVTNSYSLALINKTVTDRGGEYQEVNLDYNLMSPHLITQPAPPFENKSWYFVVFASGTVSYYDYGDYVNVFCSNPTYNFAFDGEGSTFYGQVTSVTPSSISVNPQQTAISFNVSVTHTMTFGITPYVAVPIGTYNTVSYFNYVFR